MDNGYNEDFTVVFDGSGIPDVRSFTATDLTVGRPYRFYVEASNYAGNSPLSDMTTIYACANPGVISAPTLNGIQTQTKVPIKWTAPSTNGGCAITSYEILRNGGPNALDTYTSVHTSEVENQPSLRTFDLTDLPSDILGLPIQLKMKVWNRGAYYNTSYDFLEVIIADVPDTPTAAPVSDTEYTDWSRLRLTYDEPLSGGSVLTNYEIIIDDGLGGGFVAIAGGDVNTHL
jgi:hypothetical protein